MKFSTVAIVLSTSAVALADNCRTGLNYCSQTLMNKGNYQAQLDQAAFDYNKSWMQYDQAQPGGGQGLLFTCRGGRNGLIEFVRNCPNGCIDAGDWTSDYCK
ncbi:hypothetical protein M501DRAFT_1030919 [Patellaria atrata CBS 101060]|uniref:Uncharacterized protein n=1 Tax=Patellaria atrata CBS 101060 TaxID=1346257 RepID=A0A9P4SBU6_9PEZI|nr:hypothetical protein M501DRAFT_1030919 [Patellaria atrata CBS 101060]